MTIQAENFADMAQALVSGRLDPAGFSHRHHVAVAYEMLSRHEVFEALALYAAGLRRLTEAAGVPGKFNATVTFAFISLIAARMANRDYADAAAFLSDNADLLEKGVLAPYFEAGELATDLARIVPLMPGLAAAQAERAGSRI